LYKENNGVTNLYIKLQKINHLKYIMQTKKI